MFIEDHWIFDEYRKVFKHYTPSIFVQEQMLLAIKDRAVWAETCFNWGMNDYKPSSVGKMIDYYRQKVSDKINGPSRHQRPIAQVGKPIAQEVGYRCAACFDSGLDMKPKPGGKEWELIEVPCSECAVVKVR